MMRTERIVQPIQVVAAAGMAALALQAAAQPLVVHEWGTFTSLQDETGRTFTGINSDDEPVPRFCHSLDWLLVQGTSEIPPAVAQGAPRCHPDVTMRLETPVIYFHPPPGASLPLTLSVKVAFRGGWLTEFYPAAQATGFSLRDHLTAATTSTLAWNGLTLGGEATGPATTSPVWTAPRAVEAATVTSANRESEKFLFYRGVGHVLCPLQVVRTVAGTWLEGRAQPAEQAGVLTNLSVRYLWLASFRADGQCAFRALPAITLPARRGPGKQPVLFSAPASFPSAEYATGNLASLRGQMRTALQAEGLYTDEADALLNTWELSYFKSSGLRLFFLVPRAWTDAVLPLNVSVPCATKRVMVGRLELVTPEQRALLRQLAEGPMPVSNWAGAPPYTGHMPLAYRDLGRFRNALVLDEEQLRPTPPLSAFIRVNGLNGFTGFAQ